MSEENVEFVRRLWEAADDGGIEAALELTDPDVEWLPHLAGDRVLRSEELLAFFRDFEGKRELLDATLYSVEAHDDRVLAAGSFRLTGARGLAEFQIHIVYEFSEGHLLRGRTYPTRADAREAAGLPAERRAKTGV